MEEGGGAKQDMNITYVHVLYNRKGLVSCSISFIRSIGTCFIFFNESQSSEILTPMELKIKYNR